MYKVLIADKIPESALDLIKSNDKFAFKTENGLSEPELILQISEYHAIIVRSATKITSEVINAGKDLKVIGRAGSGLDNIDLNSAKKRGIEVFNTPDSNSQSVAELTISSIFNLSRNLFHAYNSLKNKQWNKSHFLGSEIRGKTLGIVGFGNIGQKVGEMAAALGMNILVFKKHTLQRSPGYEFEMTDIDTLLVKSDFVSLHLPKTEQTTQLIGLTELEKMKHSAFLINCARGGIVSEHDLLKALNNNIISGAALDVFQSEPPVNFDIIEHPKVIATPHIGGATFESQKRVGEDIVVSVMDYLEKKYVFI
jgi:D-3-phosphoglycerate dehydrogenase